MKTLHYILIASLLGFTQLLNAQNGLKRLIPDYAKVQFAGGIGFLSAGVGYESGNKRLQGDFMYGYVPERAGGIEIHSVSSKFTWRAIIKNYKNDIRVDYLTTGLLINYAFGKRYFLLSPDNYPYSYYNFPTALHVGLFVGGGISKGRVGAYYEIGTSGKEMLSYVVNTKGLSPSDILNLAVGARFDLRK